MRFAGLAICLVLAIVSNGCRVGLVAEVPENKNVIEGSGEPVAGPTGSSGGANGGIPPSGDILPAFHPSANSNVQVADVGSVVARSENYTTLVTIDWISGGVNKGGTNTSVSLNLSVGQQKMKGGKL